MKKLTNEYAESLADKLLERINGISNDNIAITLANGAAITKESLVQTILANDNIYIPFKRTIQFSNLQDETVKNICNPVGEITMTETFNKGYSVDELLNIDLSSLDVHCEGVNTTGGVVSYGVPTSELTNVATSNAGKYYAVTYTGKTAEGSDFSANAIYNAIDPNKKDYHISKVSSATATKISTEETNISTTLGSQISSNGKNITKKLKIGDEKYSWNQYVGTIKGASNTTLYSWKDSIAEASGRIITNASCVFDNDKYSGVPVEFSVNDFSTGSSYKEENGVVTCATGSLSIVCSYAKNGSIVLEKPSFVKSESASIVSNNLSKIDNKCIGIVSVTTNSVTHSEEIVITPNLANLKSTGDISKIVEALKKWNIGSNSTTTSLQGSNIWINTSKGNNSFDEDGTYVINNYVSLSDYIDN